MTTKEALQNFKNIAVYGMSKNQNKAAHTVPVFISKQGYNVIPVNPTVDEIANLKAYHKLIDVPENIEILNVFRPSEDALNVVEEAIERKKIKGDIHLIWLQEGIYNDEAKDLAEKNGIVFIQDKCIYKEYINNF